MARNRKVRKKPDDPPRKAKGKTVPAARKKQAGVKPRKKKVSPKKPSPKREASPKRRAEKKQSPQRVSEESPKRKMSKEELLEISRKNAEARKKKRRDRRRTRLENAWKNFLCRLNEAAKEINDTPDGNDVISRALKGESKDAKGDYTLEFIAKNCALWDFNVQTKIDLILMGHGDKWPYLNGVQSDIATKFVLQAYIPPSTNVIGHKWPDLGPMSAETCVSRYQRVGKILLQAHRSIKEDLVWGRFGQTAFTGEPSQFFEKGTPMIIASVIDEDELKDIVEPHIDNGTSWRAARSAIKPKVTTFLKEEVSRLRKELKKANGDRSKMGDLELDALRDMDAFEYIFSKYCSQHKLKK